MAVIKRPSLVLADTTNAQVNVGKWPAHHPSNQQPDQARTHGMHGYQGYLAMPIKDTLGELCFNEDSQPS